MDENRVPRMLTLREAAKETGLSYDFLRRLCLQGKLVYIKSGAKFLLNECKLIEYLNKGDVPA